MSSTRAAEVTARFNKEAAEHDAESFFEHMVGHILPTIDVAQLAEKAFHALEGAIHHVVSAAIQHQDAFLRLTAAARVHGQGTEALTKELFEYDEELQRGTGLAQLELASLQERLLNYKIHGENLKAATLATIGFSQATGKDLLSSARDVAKLFHGDFTKGMKLVVSESEGATAGIEKLKDMVSLAEARIDTFGGQTGLLSKNLHTLEATVGEVVTKNHDLIDIIHEANLAVVGLTHVIEELNHAIDSGEHSWIATALSGGKEGLSIAGGFLGRAIGITPALEGLKEIKNTLVDIGREVEHSDQSKSFKNVLFDVQPKDTKPKEKKPKKPHQITESELDLAVERIETEDIIINRKKEQDEARDRVLYWQNMIELDRSWGLVRIDMRRRREKLETDVVVAANEERFQKLVALYDAREKQLNDLAIGGITAAAQALGTILGQAATGQEINAKRIAGSFISLLGGMVQQIGAAAIAAGVVGEAVPFFGTLLGGPAAIAAGGLAEIAGAAIVAAGNALGGSGTSAGSGTRFAPNLPGAGSRSFGSAGGGGSFNNGATAPGSPFGAPEAPRTYVINFNGIVGDRRSAAREIVDLVDEYEQLRPRRAS